MKWTRACRLREMITIAAAAICLCFGSPAVAMTKSMSNFSELATHIILAQAEQGASKTGKNAESKEDGGEGFWKGGGAVLLGIIPALAWIFFAVWAIVFLSPKLIGLVERIRVFKGLGLELEFAVVQRLEKASQNHSVSLDQSQRAEVRARIRRIGDVVTGMRILWADDNPGNNTEELMLLSQLGAVIFSEQTTDAATTRLKSETFDLVISDMKRGADDKAGLTLLNKMRETKVTTPMIIYTGDQSNHDRPKGLFGITNRPDELVHLVLDARERRLV